MNIEFIASVAVIAPDPPESRQLYMDAIGLPLEGQADYYHSAGTAMRGRIAA